MCSCYDGLVRRVAAWLLIVAGILTAEQPTYICPMDRDIRSAKPGICARCGMKLVWQQSETVPYAMDLRVTPRSPRPRERLNVEFMVRNPRDGRRVTSFQPVHEKLFHLFVVGENLEFFLHEHPALDATGTFHLGTQFPDAGLYRMLADVYPEGAVPQMITGSIVLSGDPPPALALTADESPKEASNVRIEISTTPAQPAPGSKTMLFFRLAPVDGLEPYLGAAGHLFAASDDLVDLMHVHPAFTSGSQVQFNVIFPRARTYRVWVQFQRKGVVNTAHFDVPVRALE